MLKQHFYTNAIQIQFGKRHDSNCASNNQANSGCKNSDRIKTLILITLEFCPNTHTQKHTTVGVLNPAEGDGSVFVALAKAEQKSPGLFFLQQDACSLPAHEPHDETETHIQNMT